MPLEVACTTDEKIVITAAPVTAGGHAAQVDGPLKVTVVSGDGTVAQDPATPLVFEVISGDAPGTTEFLVEADADLGEGVETIQDTVTLVVEGAKAAQFGLTAAAPVPK